MYLVRIPCTVPTMIPLSGHQIVTLRQKSLSGIFILQVRLAWFLLQDTNVGRDFNLGYFGFFKLYFGIRKRVGVWPYGCCYGGLLFFGDVNW